jgi:predicted RNA-binding protein with PUA-like domain
VRELRFISLDELRGMPELAECRLLARGNRLSVLPLTDAEFAAIVKRGKLSRAAPTAARR